MNLYNTLTRRKEKFEPSMAPVVRMYVCGPTTYNLIHLGNARPLVFFDTLRRYLEYRGYPVVYVQNFTDIDDKIIMRAQEEGESPRNLASSYIDEYHRDAGALGVRPATVHPQVSQHMDLIIRLLESLISKGLAYQVGANVYFSVRNSAGYGKLSGRGLDDLRVGARVEADSRKNDPLDFALWKEAGPEEPFWESPWGRGRPGWHSECVAMALHYLGPHFDIHGGGADLVFPHHENEIAQAEGYTGQAFARFWVHNGFITISQEKMSKSQGNFFLVRELLSRFPAPALRFYLLSTHYRSPLDFSLEKVEEAMRGWERLKVLGENLSQDLSGGPGDDGDDLLIQATTELRDSFNSAMDDDCNTALAIAALFEFARKTNPLLQDREKVSRLGLAAAKKAFEETASGVLGIVIPGRTGNVPGEGSGEALAGLMELVLDTRRQARERRDWATADSIRQRLAELKVVVEDTPEGTRWHLERG